MASVIHIWKALIFSSHPDFKFLKLAKPEGNTSMISTGTFVTKFVKKPGAIRVNLSIIILPKEHQEVVRFVRFLVLNKLEKVNYTKV